MKVHVDLTKCQAYGICAEIAPDVFELDEFGYAIAKHDGAVPAGSEERAVKAVADCPAQAITADR